MEEKKIIKVINRNNGFTGYSVPDLNVNRTFSPGESKNIPLEEIQQLQYVDGGDYILKHFLIIDDKDALNTLNMEDVEPEYFYTEKEIKELLLAGSLDQLEDALNFAPEGVIELIKDMAIKLELPDVRKRELIAEKLNFNVSGAIAVVREAKKEDTPAEAEGKVRKAAPIKASEAPQIIRKATPVK